MRLTLLITGAILAIPVVALLVAARPRGDMHTNPVERGRYLVTYGGCSDCHTPVKMGPKGPEPDLTRWLSGHPAGTRLPTPPDFSGPWFAGTAGFTAWAGPWGITYAPNLTPEKNTGMGIWTEAMFIKAMRTGRHFGEGRPILPPMPWQNIGALNDEDLKSIFAYLRSIPPIENRVPPPVGPNGEVEYE